MPRLVECGDDEFEGASENPVVRRLRHRRLLAFLWLKGMEGTFGSMVHETDAFFSVAHLQSVVKQGQWRDAIAYLSRFLPLVDGGDRLPSLEAQVLHHFLAAHKTLADILAGTITKEAHALDGYFCKYRDNESSTCNGTLRLRGIMVTTLRAKQHLRFSLDWERVRHRAAKIAYNLVRRTPELKRAMLLPGGPMETHNVLPIRTCTGQSCRWKKHPCRQQAPALAKHYLQRRARLLYSSHSKQSANELHGKAANWIADILDESFKAGKRLELHQESPLQTSEKQGARGKLILPDMLGTFVARARNLVASLAREADSTIAPSSKTTFGSLADPAKNLCSMSVESAGKVACNAPTPAAPFLGLLSHFEKSGTTLMADIGESLKAGEPLELHQERPLQTSGKHGALSNQISQGMFGTLTYDRNTVDSSVRRAGATSAPISETMFGTMAGPARNPGKAVANAGTHEGELARCVLSPSDPVSKTIFGATVSETSSSRNSISLMTNAGTTKHPREVAASEEHNNYSKRQRTSGAFAEAMTSAIRT